MWIGFVLEEEFRDVVIVVVERDHHGRRAFGRRQIDIGACIEKRFDAPHATPTGCVQQRCKPTIRVILRARFRCNLAWPVVVLGASVYGGALRDQNLYHLRTIARGSSSPHQWRLVLDFLDDVDLRAGINEHLENREVAILDGKHQGGLSVGVGAFGARSGIHQHLDHAGIALLGGFRQGRVSELVRDVYLGLLRDQRR